eukprot:m.112764 g.112764  ORF g.112764 m.112764 type:complete len:83 (-) comp12789_c1_seq16:1412-1660(-)
MCLRGRWKLVHNSESCSQAECKVPQLFDLETDLAETMDVSAKYPTVFNSMLANLTRWVNGVLESRNVQHCPNFTTEHLPSII